MDINVIGEFDNIVVNLSPSKQHRKHISIKEKMDIFDYINTIKVQY
jgi:hypothetical protein